MDNAGRYRASSHALIKHFLTPERSGSLSSEPSFEDYHKPDTVGQPNQSCRCTSCKFKKERGVKHSGLLQYLQKVYFDDDLEDFEVAQLEAVMNSTMGPLGIHLKAAEKEKPMRNKRKSLGVDFNDTDSPHNTSPVKDVLKGVKGAFRLIEGENRARRAEREEKFHERQAKALQAKLDRIKQGQLQNEHSPPEKKKGHGRRPVSAAPVSTVVTAREKENKRVWEGKANSTSPSRRPDSAPAAPRRLPKALRQVGSRIRQDIDGRATAREKEQTARDFAYA
eukprot:CAMPEP_0182877078 /NCGR_PEP_ID=MMETSP0034_2-20130328/14538_1 /TAXON_ID=156128 /ORGANISM="Nephroselmis pyriformis, Strain CCMP717" /LENGTH=279 /DNA_ID=CAMNT_0025009903 /DNA_START=28 /DNA_END=864 /DNA_ORIENTATION=+